jgi:protein-S-isoprenylcysteine O-methyltransferase Ste14
VRPPLVYASSILAIVLFVLSVRALRAAGTPVPGNQPTTSIVRTGPFRFSRNPIYLSFAVLQLGIALWIGSIWMMATLIPAAALVSSVVVRREERYLENRFGQQYADYRNSVRRWL